MKPDIGCLFNPNIPYVREDLRLMHYNQFGATKARHVHRVEDVSEAHCRLLHDIFFAAIEDFRRTYCPVHIGGEQWDATAKSKLKLKL
jgi:hypothetical protein